MKDSTPLYSKPCNNTPGLDTELTCVLTKAVEGLGLEGFVLDEPAP